MNGVMGRIRFERLRHGWSQAELGRIAGLQQKFVSLIEQGRLIPSPHQLARLSGALGVPEAELRGPTVVVMHPDWPRTEPAPEVPQEVTR